MINVYYKSEMVINNNGFSPSSYKPKMVVEDWIDTFPKQINIISFDSLVKNDFFKIHEEKYVNGVFDGSIVNGFGIKSKEFGDVFCATSGSLLAASYDALKNKVAISPSSGFHHARWNKAEGFCTFNALVLVSVILKERGLVDKVGILDFDMHFGNGTSEIIKKYDLSYIVHYTAGKKYDLNYPILKFLKPIVKIIYNKRFKNKKVRPRLRQRLLRNKGSVFIENLGIILDSFKNCDLIIYQAGADQHVNDPYGGLLTYEQMKERDLKVFDFAKKNNIPIVWNLAGGYQKNEFGNIEPVLECHRNTLEECLKIFKDK